jgi:hypothetical protein
MENNTNEIIIASAIQLANGQVFVGKRHSNAQENAMNILGEDNYFNDRVLGDGFVTSLPRFIDRKEAYILARKNGQFKREENYKACRIKNGYDGEELFSEDLWL